MKIIIPLVFMLAAASMMFAVSASGGYEVAWWLAHWFFNERVSLIIGRFGCGLGLIAAWTVCHSQYASYERLKKLLSENTDK